MDDLLHSLDKRDGSSHHKHNHGLASPPGARLLVVLGVVLWGRQRVARGLRSERHFVFDQIRFVREHLSERGKANLCIR